MRSLKSTKAKTNLITKLLPTLVVFAITLVGFQTLKTHHIVSAACTIPATTYGTDTITVKVTATATYRIWTNMQIPSTSDNGIFLQVDGGNCYDVGGNSAEAITPTWDWIDYQDGATTNTISQSLTAGTHTLEYIGTEPGVAIDNVILLSDTSCTPSGVAGTNCAPTQTPPSVSISAPASGASVNGTAVALGAAASDFSGISSVVYSINGTTIGSSTTSPYSTTWNSTTLANGSYTLTATATDENNLTNTATEPITVANNTCSGNPTAPSTVTDTDATPLPANKVDLSWGVSTAATNCTLKGYNIYRSGSTTPLNTTPVTTTTYSDTTVAASTKYTYQVEAVDTAGHISAASPTTPLSVTTGAAAASCSSSSAKPSTPANLTETANNYTTVTLGWGASTAASGCTLTGYHVFRNGTELSPGPTGTTLTFEDSGLTSGTSYTYTVESYDSSGNVSASTAGVSMSTLKDNVAPTIPAGLTATSPSSGTVNLTWAASTDLPNPGGVGVSGYVITQTAPTAETYKVVGGTVTSFSVPSVSASTKYTFEIAAYDANSNTSVNSATVSVTTGTAVASCTGNPSVPTALTSSAKTDTTITVGWGASTAASGCTLKGYEVYINNVYTTTVTSGTSYTATSLSPNSNYIFTLMSEDTSGHLSAATADYTVATSAETTAPTSPGSPTAKVLSPTQVEISWTASTDAIGVTSYNIYRNGGTTPYASVAGTVTTYTDTNATADTSYTYTVQAENGAGNKSAAVATNPATVTTTSTVGTTKPTTPGGLTSTVVTATSVSFSWTASTSGATILGYNVYRNGTLIGFASGTSYTDSANLAASTSYTYTVVATDSSGNDSAASAGLVVKTLAATTTYLSADLNEDGQVNVFDLAIMLAHWDQTVTPGARTGDINGDGIVNIYDLNIMLNQWTG
jgi:chitodextrinase